MTGLYSLLVVDDDRRIRDLLEKYLSQNGYMVTTAQDAENAQKYLDQEKFSLMILDVMMPGQSGIDFCKALRDSTHVQRAIPILMLTALGDPMQRLQGLETGADDYVTKPFEPKELLLRLEKILQPPTPSLVMFGEYTYNISQQALYKQGAPVFLTTTELLLLDALCKNPRITISREVLAKQGGATLTPRTVDVQITRLRKKIEDDIPQYIRTIRHQGYALWPNQAC